MKTHAIVPIFALLLLFWIGIWDLPSTDAGGPPVRLAVERQVTRFADQTEEEFPGTTQLIPTEWDRSPELIPTDIDQQKARWVRQKVDASNLSDGHLFNNGKQLPWAEPPFFRASESIVNEFLDGHFSQSPLSPNSVVVLGTEEPVLAPWIVGETPWDLALGHEFPVHIRLPLYHPGITPEYVTDRTWLPANQWWSRVLKPRKSTL